MIGPLASSTSVPLVYYAYTPHKRLWERQPSLRAIDLIHDAGYRVTSWPCRDDLAFAAGLRACWDYPGPLVIIEHDVAPTLEQFETLIACPHPACAGVYWIALGVAGRRPMLSACRGPLGTTVEGQTLNPRVDPDAQWGGYSAIGFCKLAAELRTEGNRPGLVPWTDVEFAVNRASGSRWHLHWPLVGHHHGFMEDSDAAFAARAAPGAT